MIAAVKSIHLTLQLPRVFRLEGQRSDKRKQIFNYPGNHKLDIAPVSLASEKSVMNLIHIIHASPSTQTQQAADVNLITID